MTYINIQYSQKITPEKFDGIHVITLDTSPLLIACIVFWQPVFVLQADDVYKVLSEQFHNGVMTNKDDFLASLEKDRSFRPYGELVHSYTRPCGKNTASMQLMFMSIFMI